MSEESDARDNEEERRSDRGLEQAKLRGDIDRVRSYGEAHPDVWVDLWFENEPSVRIVTAFVGEEVDVHEAALRNLMDHPDQLKVDRSGIYSRTHLEAIQDEVRQIATTTEQGSFASYGIVRGKLNIAVRASRLDLAQRLFNSYGDAVKLQVGHLSFPDPMKTDPDMPRSGAPAPERPPLLPMEEIRVSLEEGLEVRSGEHLRSTLHVNNDGPTEIVVMTNGAVTARIVDPQTKAVVGGYEFAQTAVGRPVRIPPQGSVDVPLLVGTASNNPLLGYCVPPGRWSIEVWLSLEDRGHFRSPLLPIDVIA
jgi:hypothetical protein